MKKILVIGISMTLLMVIGGCSNDEARRKYEQEMQNLEQMQEDHKLELNRAIATGASETQIRILKIEHAQQEMKQSELVYQLAKEAGV